MRDKATKAELKSPATNRLGQAFQQELFDEQEKRAANTARLRGLRLAKEAREREADEEKRSRDHVIAESKPAAKKARLIKGRATSKA